MPAALACVVRLESPNESKSHCLARSHWRVMGVVWLGIPDKKERSRTKERWNLKFGVSLEAQMLNSEF
jgi:hypothetical protein